MVAVECHHSVKNEEKSKIGFGDQIFPLLKQRDAKSVLKILNENFSRGKSDNYGDLNDIKDCEGFSILHWAALVGNFDLVQNLIEIHKSEVDSIGCSNLQTPLMWAAMENRLIVVYFLIKKYGADIEKKDSQGDTAFLLTIQNEAPYASMLLASLGANINAVNNRKIGAAHWALYIGNISCYRALETMGSDFSENGLRDQDDLLPFHRAIMSHEISLIADLIFRHPNLTKVKARDLSVDEFAAKVMDPTTLSYCRQIEEWEYKKPEIAQEKIVEEKVSEEDPPVEPSSSEIASSSSSSSSSNVTSLLEKEGIFIQFRNYLRELAFKTWWILPVSAMAMWTVFYASWYYWGIYGHQVLLDETLGSKKLSYSSIQIMIRHFLGFLVLCETLALVQFVILLLIDPGKIEMIQDKCKSCEIMFYKYYRDEAFVKKLEDNNLQAKQLVDLDRVCRTCNIFKDLRTKHCPHCKSCIQRMDHHCVWIGKCVGSNNHGIFLSFLLCGFLSHFYRVSMIIFSLVFWCYNVFLGKNSPALKYQVAGPDTLVGWIILILTLCIDGTTLPWGTALLYHQIENILQNITVNEEINWVRYPHFILAFDVDANNDEGPVKRSFKRNPWDRGIFSNIREFLFYRKRIVLIDHDNDDVLKVQDQIFKDQMVASIAKRKLQTKKNGNSSEWWWWWLKLKHRFSTKFLSGSNNIASIKEKNT